MYKFFIGVDVSKKTIDVSWTDGPKPLYLGSFPNNEKGFQKMIEGLSKHTQSNQAEWLICFENTGSYSKPILYWMVSHCIPCIEESPLKIKFSSGIKRGKSDKQDSRVICDYVYIHRDRLQPTSLEKPKIQELKKLLSQRELMIRHKHAIDISLVDQKDEISPPIFKEMEAQNKLVVVQCQKNIDCIEKLIEKLMQSEPAMAENNKLAQSVIGIGPISAWYMIAFTDNFSPKISSRMFANYVGVAPHPYQSGTSIQGNCRTSKMANQQIKAILSNGIHSAIQHDPQIRDYYTRKKAEGKPNGVVFNNVKNKLIIRVFSTIQRGTPYVKLGAHA